MMWTIIVVTQLASGKIIANGEMRIFPSLQACNAGLYLGEKQYRESFPTIIKSILISKCVPLKYSTPEECATYPAICRW